MTMQQWVAIHCVPKICTSGHFYIQSHSLHVCSLAEPMHEQRGGLNVPMDISSPITSDEEYLSPLEEGMDFGGPYCQAEPRKIVDIRFREPPVFQVPYQRSSNNYSLRTYILNTIKICNQNE